MAFVLQTVGPGCKPGLRPDLNLDVWPSRGALPQDDAYQQEVEGELRHVLCASVAAGALEMAHHALAALSPDAGLLSAAAAHSSAASDEWPLLTTLQLLELLASSPALGPAEGNALL